MSTVTEPRPSHRATTTGPTTTAPTPGDEAPTSAMRASDAERETTIARLHHALGEGRLDLAETDLRVAAAYDARYRSDLSPLLADLPGSPDVPSLGRSEVPAWSAIWTSLVWRARLIVLGTSGSGRTPPTAAQCRNAAVLTVLAVVWLVASAFLGAAVVGP